MALPSERWILTMVFGATTAYCLIRCWILASMSVHHSAVAWATEVAHLGMGASMVGMVWSVGSRDRWGVQLAAFAVFGGLFLIHGLVGAQGCDLGARTGLLYDAMLMAAMCWMVSSMTASTPLHPMVGMVGMVGMAHSGGDSGALTGATNAGFLGVLGVSVGVWAWRALTIRATRAGTSRFGRFFVDGRVFAASQCVMSGGMAGAVATML